MNLFCELVIMVIKKPVHIWDGQLYSVSLLTCGSQSNHHEQGFSITTQPLDLTLHTVLFHLLFLYCTTILPKMRVLIDFFLSLPLYFVHFMSVLPYILYAIFMAILNLTLKIYQNSYACINGHVKSTFCSTKGKLETHSRKHIFRNKHIQILK